MIFNLVSYMTLSVADKESKNILGSMPKYFWGAGEQLYYFQDSGSTVKLILGSRRKYFRGAREDLSITFREQWSSDSPGGVIKPLNYEKNGNTRSDMAYIVS